LRDHAVNAALRRVNRVIKLIFKNNSKQEVTMFDESKIPEIRTVLKEFGLLLPKRFESKSTMREYFQSKEFIVGLKTKMN